MQEVREKKRKKGKIIIVGKMIIYIYRKLGGKMYMKKKRGNKQKNKNSKIKKNIIMWGLVMLVHAWGLANKMKSCSSSERVQAGVGHQGRGYQVPVACGSDEERELETVFIDTGYIVA